MLELYIVCIINFNGYIIVRDFIEIYVLLLKCMFAWQVLLVAIYNEYKSSYFLIFILHLILHQLYSITYHFFFFPYNCLKYNKKSYKCIMTLLVVIMKLKLKMRTVRDSVELGKSNVLLRGPEHSPRGMIEKFTLH